MRKNQVDEILVNQTKRRKTIINYSLIILIVFILSIAFYVVYFKNSRPQFVNFSENSNIDYKVY